MARTKQDNERCPLIRTGGGHCGNVRAHQWLGETRSNIGIGAHFATCETVNQEWPARITGLSRVELALQNQVLEEAAAATAEQQTSPGLLVVAWLRLQPGQATELDETWFRGDGPRDRQLAELTEKIGKHLREFGKGDLGTEPRDSY